MLRIPGRESIADAGFGIDLQREGFYTSTGKETTNMHYLSRRFLLAGALVALLAALGSGCACCKSKAPKETRISAQEMSPPARATVEKVTAGGSVDQVTREAERGQTVYDVEATIGGQHREFLIADSTGEVLGTEVPIEFANLPEPVRAAAERYFDATAGLTVMKGVEYGETQYEIEGPRKGKKVEATFDPQGKRLP
jgi:hypothetical protein